MEGIPNEKKKIGAFAKCRSCIQILDMALAHFKDTWGQQNRKYQLFESMTLDLTSILLNILHGEKDIISYFLFEISVKNFTFSSKDNYSIYFSFGNINPFISNPPFLYPPENCIYILNFGLIKSPPTSWKFAHSSHLEKSPSQWTPPPTKFLFTPLSH